FAVDHFKLRRVPQRVARVRMQRKLRSVHPRYQLSGDRQHADSAPALPAALEELWNEYCCLFTHDGVGLILYEDWQNTVEVVQMKLFAQKIAQASPRQWNDADGWPLISVLLPVFNTPESLLRRCIESVLRQSYPKWELCSADDGSTDEHVRRVLQQYAARSEERRVGNEW